LLEIGAFAVLLGLFIFPLDVSLPAGEAGLRRRIAVARGRVIAGSCRLKHQAVGGIYAAKMRRYHGSRRRALSRAISARW
jgi:predicted transporter